MSHIHFVILPASPAFLLRANVAKQELLDGIAHPIDVTIESTLYDQTMSQRKAKWPSHCILVIGNKCAANEVIVDFHDRSPQKMSISDVVELINSYSDETDIDFGKSSDTQANPHTTTNAVVDKDKDKDKNKDKDEINKDETNATIANGDANGEQKGGCIIM